MPTGLWLYSYLALWGLLVVTGVLLVGILRHVADLHAYWMQHDPAWGLPLGAVAPVLPTEDFLGRPLSIGAGRGRKTTLLFVSRGSSACRRVMTDVPVLAAREDIELVLVVVDQPDNARQLLQEARREVNFPNMPVLVDHDRALTQQYSARSVPHAVIIDEEGRVGAMGVASLGGFEALLQQADSLRARRPAVDDLSDPLRNGAEAEIPARGAVAA